MGRACIPQPGTSVKIDHLGYRQRPLFRLPTVILVTHEALVTNQSVSAGNGPNGEVSGIRWWEIRNPNGGRPFSSRAPMRLDLRMGSIAGWEASRWIQPGNIAMGYSASNGTNPAVFPSVFYTGRMAGDPPGR